MTTPIRTEVPGLFMLPLPTPFPIGRINAYLAQGDDLTLIDTGVNSEQSWAALVAGLNALGAQPADLDRIIITHHHTDHVGQVERLAALSGAAVWSHPACAPYIETPQPARDRLCEWSLRLWREGGAPPSLLELTGQLFKWFDTLGNEAVSLAGTLPDGAAVDLLGGRWDVLHTPGHAGDLICLYEPASGVLLSSDHLIRDVSSNALVEPPQPGHKRPRRLIEYMEQLQRVADLQPRLAYAGHGDPVTDVPALVAERLDFHRQRAEHVLALLADGPLNLYELATAMFPRVAEVEMFLAMSEVLGHLDWLERDGRVARVLAAEGTDVIGWRAA